MNWKKIRKDFPVTGRGLYLDHAAGGPVPLPVVRAVEQYYSENARQADFIWPRWLARVEECRRAAADFIHAHPDEIAFISNTSHGMNLIAELLAREGAVLAPSSEFPSTTLPWIAHKAEMLYQEPEEGRLSLEKTRTLLAPRVRTILTSYVQYATGFRQDMRALGRLKQDRFLAVNATQGLGVLPVDVRAWKADFLCANSYKWLMAGYGGGILYVRRKWLARFKPSFLGWRGVENADAMNNRNTRILKRAARYELGCPSFPTIFAVGAAVKYLAEIGVENIEKRLLALTDFAAGLLEKKGLEIVSPRGAGERSGILVFRVPRAKRVWKRLLARDVFVTPRGAGLRLAPHIYNTEDEIESFVKKLTVCMDAEVKSAR